MGLFLTGNYTVRQIKQKMDSWGFRTVQHKHSGGRLISYNGMHRILTNKFYAGILEYKGEEHRGAHEPMITLEEYEPAQALLGRRSNPRPQKYEFAFTGTIRCGECGCMVTAENKHKIIKKTKEQRSYRYYHCTRQKVGHRCKQPSLDEVGLEQQIEKSLGSFTILPELKDFALDILRRENDKEIIARRTFRSYKTRQSQICKNSLINSLSCVSGRW